MLSISKSDAAKMMHGTKVPCKTWSDYCTEIGSSKAESVRVRNLNIT